MVSLYKLNLKIHIKKKLFKFKKYPPLKTKNIDNLSKVKMKWVSFARVKMKWVSFLKKIKMKIEIYD